MTGPLERVYGKYRITLRKIDHTQSSEKPEPHVEVWKGNRFMGRFDMATGRFLREDRIHPRIPEILRKYLKDPQVKRKIKEMIKESYFDLHKPAGHYGAIPVGVKVTITVEFTEENLGKV